MIVRKTFDMNFTNCIVNAFSEILQILFIQCRNKQGISLDETDLPISPKYLNDLLEITSIEKRTWLCMNFSPASI